MHNFYNKSELESILKLFGTANEQVRNDDAISLAKSLDYVKGNIYKTTPVALEGVDIVPRDTEVPEWAETVTYKVYDQVGMAKIIANYADDLPRSDVSATEKTVRLQDVGGSYGYNVAELRASQATGANLPQRKGNAARWAIEVTLGRIVLEGSPDYGLYGLTNHPNINVSNPTNGDWNNNSTTAEMIYEDVTEMFDDVRDASNDIHTPNTLLIPRDALRAMRTKYITGNAGVTAYDIVKQNYPELVIKDLRLLNGSSGSRSAFIGEFNAENIGHIMPMPFRQLTAQPRNLELVIPCLARTGGVAVYRPLAISKATNI